MGVQNKYCGNCKHFKDEDASGKGWCEEQSWVSECSKVCKCHEPNLNGWTEITPDNVDEVYENRHSIVITNPSQFHYIVTFHTATRKIIELYANKGGYYYYIIPELKIE